MKVRAWNHQIAPPLSHLLSQESSVLLLYTLKDAEFIYKPLPKEQLLIIANLHSYTMGLWLGHKLRPPNSFHLWPEKDFNVDHWRWQPVAGGHHTTSQALNYELLLHRMLKTKKQSRVLPKNRRFPARPNLLFTEFINFMFNYFMVYRFIYKIMRMASHKYMTIAY